MGAEAQGVPMLRRLPIKSLGPPGMSPVLNIDVVVAILHERFTKGPDSSWRDIFLHCMPQRQQPGPTRQMRRRERKQIRKDGGNCGEDEQPGEEEDGEASSDSAESELE